MVPRKPISTEKGRVCSNCGKFKFWSEFHIKNATGALNSKTASCKICRNNKQRIANYRFKYDLPIERISL